MLRRRRIKKTVAAGPAILLNETCSLAIGHPARAHTRPHTLELKNCMGSLTQTICTSKNQQTPWQDSVPSPTPASLQRATTDLCMAAHSHQQLTGDTLCQATQSVLKLQRDLTKRLRAPAAFHPVRRKEVYSYYYEMAQLRTALPSLVPSLEHCRESVAQVDEEALCTICHAQRNDSVESLSQLRVDMDVANSVYCCSPTERIRQSARAVRDSCMDLLVKKHAVPYKEKPLTGHLETLQLAATNRALAGNFAAQNYLQPGEHRIDTRALYSEHTHYIISNTLGLGSFGKFRGGYNVQTGQLLGVKEHRIGLDVNSYGNGPLRRKTFSTDPASYHQELSLLQQLNSPCAPTDTIVINNRIYWIVKLLRGDLAKLIFNKSRAGRLQLAALSGVDVALQLSRLHDLSYIHCDVKPANILYDEGHLVLSDLGLATQCGQGAMQRVSGSWEFMPLEVLLKHTGGHSIDTWSLGITLLTTLAGQMPFSAQGPSKYDQLKGQVNQFLRQRQALLDQNSAVGGLDVTAWPTAVAGKLSTLPCCAQISPPLVAYVLEHMLHPNPTMRPTLAQVAQTFRHNFELFTGGIAECDARQWLAQQTDHAARDAALRAVLQAHVEVETLAASKTAAEIKKLADRTGGLMQLPRLKV
jgi:serine/threonine protein kinase